MIILKDLDFEGLSKQIENYQKWKKVYLEIFEVAKLIEISSVQLRKECISDNDFIEKMNSLKIQYHQKHEKEFIDFLIKHFTSEKTLSNRIKLELDDDTSNPRLVYDLSFRFELDTSTIENKVMALSFNLRIAEFLSEDYYNNLNSEVYKNFENMLLKNPDILDWFSVFVNEVEWNFYNQKEQVTKAINYVNVVFNKLTENKKTEFAKLKEEYENDVKQLNAKIIKPKSYDRENLADYFLDVAKRKHGKPSVRDLEKGSSIQKDKWNRWLNEDYRLIGNIFMRLQEEIKHNPEIENKEWFKNLLTQYQIKFAEMQSKERRLQNKSFAKNFNENKKRENELDTF